MFVIRLHKHFYCEDFVFLSVPKNKTLDRCNFPSYICMNDFFCKYYYSQESFELCLRKVDFEGYQRKMLINGKFTLTNGFLAVKELN